MTRPEQWLPSFICICMAQHYADGHCSGLAFLLLRHWILTADAPDAIKLDSAAPGYVVLHRHRGLSTDRRAGVALIHRESIKATSVITPSLSHCLWNSSAVS